MRHEIRVIFGDTDQMGVVYYANYLRYFEGSRAAYWRSFGKTHKDIEAWGIALPVIEAHCEYKRPAHYEDLIAVEVHVSELRSASMRFSYEVTRDGVQRMLVGEPKDKTCWGEGMIPGDCLASPRERQEM